MKIIFFFLFKYGYIIFDDMSFINFVENEEIFVFLIKLDCNVFFDFKVISFLSLKIYVLYIYFFLCEIRTKIIKVYMAKI